MAKNLARWQKDFAEKGLVIIDIDDGEADTLEVLRAHVEKGKTAYATLWDKASKNVEKYGVQGFPASYLVGVDGKVIWEGFAPAKVKEVEELLKKELAKIKKEDLEKWKEEKK